MDKFKKWAQILKLFPIAALLIITPLLATSLRSTYLYFIVNILIIVVGAEAGLFSFFLDSPENKKRAAALKPAIISEISPDDKEKTKTGAQFGNGSSSSSDKVVEKCSSDEILGAVKEQTMKKSPSTPSIFFIGSGGGEAEELVEDNDDEGGEIGGQEMFQKAETFIGNFYEQLKMQREESWKKLHDLYQKAF